MSAATTATPWLLLGTARREALASRLSAAIDGWRRDWIPETTGSFSVSVIESVRARPTDIRAHEAACFCAKVNGTSSLAFVVPRRTLPALVGVPPQGTESHRFAEESGLATFLEIEALTRLAKWLWPAAAGKTTLELERISQGAVDVLRQYDEKRYVCASIALVDKHCTVDVLLAPALVEALLPARPRVSGNEALERRRSAAASQVVEVVGVLGVAEVPVSELAALAIGDVIVLQQKLTDPAVLMIRGGERAGDVLPGRVGEMRAVQIKGRAA